MLWLGGGGGGTERKSSRIFRFYLLTPRSRVPIEKLPGFQQVKKFPALYVIQRFITAFTSARHVSLSLSSSTHSVPPHLNIGLPSMPGPPKWSLSLRFPHRNPVYVSPVPHTRYMPSQSNSRFFFYNLKYRSLSSSLDS